MIKPICVNGSNCQGSSALPPCVGNCGGGSSGGGSFPVWDINDAYLVDTVVLYNGELYVANSDIPPGTPFEVGDIPGTWRATEAGTSSAPPFNPESSYAQYRIVLYEGRQYVANTALPAGPFNPADWTEVLVTGAVGTNDTVSIDLSGNGTAGDPLTAAINLDPSEKNLLEITPDGLILNSDLIPPPSGGGSIISQGVTLNVDTITGNDGTADGTLGKPYLTVAAAMNAATPNDVVMVWPGVYDAFIPKANVSLRTQGRVTINAPLTIGVTGFRMSNVTLMGAITFSGSTGNVVLEDIVLSNNDVIFTGVNSGAYLLRNFSMSGVLLANDASQGATAVTIAMFGDGDGSPSVTTDMTNGRVYVGNRQNIGNVLARKGLLVLSDAVRIQNIDYTAVASSATMLVVKNVSSFDPVQRAYSVITKTGNAAYVFSNFSRDPTTDESAFEGVKTIVENGRDISGQHIPVNYAITGVTLPEHLKGIDDALLNAGGPGEIDLAFSLTGGWDADEILFAYALVHTVEFAPDFEGSSAISSDVVNSTLVLEIVLPGEINSTPFGTVTFDNGTVTFSGGGNTAPEGSTIILKGGVATDFAFLALTIPTTIQEPV